MWVFFVSSSSLTYPSKCRLLGFACHPRIGYSTIIPPNYFFTRGHSLLPFLLKIDSLELVARRAALFGLVDSLRAINTRSALKHQDTEKSYHWENTTSLTWIVNLMTTTCTLMNSRDSSSDLDSSWPACHCLSLVTEMIQVAEVFRNYETLRLL